MNVEPRKAFLQSLFEVGVDACRAEKTLPAYLPKEPPKGRTIVLGAGKAAADMASVVSDYLEGDVSGCVVTRYNHSTDNKYGGIEFIEAGHPIPDENSLYAADRLLSLARNASADDRVIFLISGGGSALLVKPIAGISLTEKREITQALLRAGAPITDINFVRKHLSAVKGGGLAAVTSPAEQFTYIISDVVGDNPLDIASGPTQKMQYDIDAAIATMRRYDINISDRMIEALIAADRSSIEDHETTIIARNHDAIQAVERTLLQLGWEIENLGTELEGEAHTIGLEHADYIKSKKQNGVRQAFISGGELTVTVDVADGCGGPNLEYLAGLVSGMSHDDGYAAIACDSDGIDGTEDNAGAYADDRTLQRFEAMGKSFSDLLKQHRTYDAFHLLDDLIVTGPTRTNVNDIRIILVNDNDTIAA